MSGCAPVQVGWEPQQAPDPWWICWVVCHGCQRYCRANIAASVALDPERAEQMELSLLEYLHDVG